MNEYKKTDILSVQLDTNLLRTGIMKCAGCKHFRLANWNTSDKMTKICGCCYEKSTHFADHINFESGMFPCGTTPDGKPKGYKKEVNQCW